MRILEGVAYWLFAVFCLTDANAAGRVLLESERLASPVMICLVLLLLFLYFIRPMSIFVFNLSNLLLFSSLILCVVVGVVAAFVTDGVESESFLPVLRSYLTGILVVVVARGPSDGPLLRDTVAVPVLSSVYVAIGLLVVFSAAVSNIAASVSLLSSDGRAMGLFLNPNHAGLSAACGFVLGLAVVLRRQAWRIGLLTMFLSLAALILSASRVNVLALFVAVVLLLLRLLWLRGLRPVFALALLLVVLLGVVAAVWAEELSVQSGRWTALADILFTRELTDGNTSGRVTLWRVGLGRVLESPMLGHGLGAMSTLNVGVTPSAPGLSPHNFYISLAGESGVFPVVLYSAFLVAAFLALLRSSGTVLGDASLGWIVVFAISAFSFDEFFVMKSCCFLLGVISRFCALRPVVSSSCLPDVLLVPRGGH